MVIEMSLFCMVLFAFGMWWGYSSGKRKMAERAAEVTQRMMMQSLEAMAMLTHRGMRRQMHIDMLEQLLKKHGIEHPELEMEEREQKGEHPNAAQNMA